MTVLFWIFILILDLSEGEKIPKSKIESENLLINPQIKQKIDKLAPKVIIIEGDCSK